MLNSTAPLCRVCRRPVASNELVAFGAFKRELFVTHTGACAETVRNGTRSAIRVAGKIFQALRPNLFEQTAQAVEAVQRVRHALKNGE